MSEDPKIARRLAAKDVARLLETARAVGGKDFHAAGYDASSVGSTAALGDGEGVLVELTIGMAREPYPSLRQSRRQDVARDGQAAPEGFVRGQHRRL